MSYPARLTSTGLNYPPLENTMENSEDSKTCTNCGQVKPLTSFRVKKSRCKDCEREYARQWRAENPDYDREYRLENKDYFAEYDRQYLIENPEVVRRRNRVRREREASAEQPKSDWERDQIRGWQ